MTELARFVLLGLAVGAIYALTAQGLVLVYRGSGVVNFAQGGLAMLGAFLYYRGTRDYQWSKPLAWFVALAVPALVAVLTHVLVMTRLRRASSLVRVVATLAVFFTIVAVGTELWGSDAKPVRSPLPTTPRLPFASAAPISEDRFWIIGIAVVITIVLSALFRFTRWGWSTEAVSENPVAASALGYSPDRIAIVNWAVGGVLAALAGVLVAPILFLNVAGLAFTVLRGLAAALIGSFRSFWLALAGGLGIGVVESVLGRYIEHDGVFKSVTNADGLLFDTFTAQSVSRSVAFLIIVVVLLLSGRALPLRNEILDRLPVVGSGRPQPAVLAVAVVGAVGVLLSAPDDWALALTISLATAIVCLSLVVVTGFSGQISLAQMALAGFGAWVAGRLSVHGWPFLLALLAGVVLTIPLGIVVALPALRTRGITFAVLTFGLSVVISELVLSNSGLTGGVQETRPKPPTLFGLKVDAFHYPGRYGLVALTSLLGVSLAVANVRRGRSGLRLLAVRANERAAASLGVNVAVAKLYAFALGSGIAALGGTLIAFRTTSVVYPLFGGFASVQVVVITVIGGIGYVIGPLFAGTLAVNGLGTRLTHALGFEDNILNLVSGVLLLVILFANPNGLAHANVRSARRLAGRRRSSSTLAPSKGDAVDVREEATGELQLPGARLSVADLTVRFGGVTAVDGVTLDIRPGEVLGLIGPNGAGKTTLIDAVTGFVRADATSNLALDDIRIERWSAMRRARAGLVRSWQSLELFEDITVRENLLVACDDGATAPLVTDLVRGRRPALTPAAVAAVREFGLVDDLDRYPDELSHGRRRLVAIARTIAASPKVLFLDEPASGLSSVESEELGHLIGRLAHQSGLAVLLIEHDVDLVMAVCDRVAVLNFGRLVTVGTPAEVAADPQVVAAYLGTDEAADHLAAGETVG